MHHDLFALIHGFVIEFTECDETQKQLAAGNDRRYRVVGVTDDLDGLIDFRVQFLNGGNWGNKKQIVEPHN